MPIANQEMIRDNNRRLVLEYIVNNPPVSRADLSKHLKLTKATISAIVQDLLLQNLILEKQPDNTNHFHKGFSFHQTLSSNFFDLIFRIKAIGQPMALFLASTFCATDGFLGQNLQQLFGILTAFVADSVVSPFAFCPPNHNA